jgi:hypothetical protein
MCATCPVAPIHLDLIILLCVCLCATCSAHLVLLVLDILIIRATCPAHLPLFDLIVLLIIRYMACPSNPRFHHSNTNNAVYMPCRFVKYSINSCHMTCPSNAALFDHSNSNDFRMPCSNNFAWVDNYSNNSFHMLLQSNADLFVNCSINAFYMPCPSNPAWCDHPNNNSRATMPRCSSWTTRTVGPPLGEEQITATQLSSQAGERKRFYETQFCNLSALHLSSRRDHCAAGLDAVPSCPLLIRVSSVPRASIARGLQGTSSSATRNTRVWARREVNALLVGLQRVCVAFC